MSSVSLSVITENKEATIVRMENSYLRVDITPTVGGRIVSLISKGDNYDFLWRNSRVPLQRLATGSAYDPHFYGGIDELLPNDCPESLCGVPCPDHGELWTTSCGYEIADNELILHADLAYGLRYERRMSFTPDGTALSCCYTLTNIVESERPFLWKLHAALAIAEGDRIVCPAAEARPLDMDWTRCREKKTFLWPLYGELDMSRIPSADGSAEFLCLSGLADGFMRWERPATGQWFEYRFDPAVFRWCWYFASFGKFDGHYVAILEPCTCGCYRVAEALSQGLCAFLNAGESLRTTVTIRVGKD